MSIHDTVCVVCVRAGEYLYAIVWVSRLYVAVYLFVCESARVDGIVDLRVASLPLLCHATYAISLA